MDQFSCRTKILSGAGAVQGLAQLKSSKLLLVTDPFFVKNGVAQSVAEAAKAAQVKIFDGVQPDPSATLAAQGTAVVKEFQPDTVVALGGGSTMDCAKAMVYFSGLSPCLVAIPTTSGSGSEVTDFAILTHKDVKHPLVDASLCPQMAILDTDLLKELPKQLVADTGFDVLSHAAEAFVAANAGAITDALAGAAFAMALEALPASFAGDMQAREQMHMAATMAGMAFTQAGLGLCHAMAHALGGAFHIPHGRLNAILLPAVVGYNASFSADKYAQLARRSALGAAAQSLAVRNLKSGLIRLRRELGLPQTLTQAGVDPRQIRQQRQQLIEAALADVCCTTNPAPVDAAVVGALLEEVAGVV